MIHSLASVNMCNITIFFSVFVQFTTYTPLLILTGILGSLRSLVHIAQPIVLAEHLPIERYPPAYGLYMLLAGVISLSVGPLIGKLQCTLYFSCAYLNSNWKIIFNFTTFVDIKVKQIEV